MRHLKGFLLFILLIVHPGSTEAGVSVTLDLDRSEATLADSVRVVVRISGTRSTQAEPVIKRLEDFRVSRGGTSSRIEIVNGKVNAGIDHTYYIQPKKAGTFQIGPAEIQIEGKRYQSRSQTLSVVKPAEYKGSTKGELFLNAEISAKTLYVEEQAVYTVKFYRRTSVRDISIELPENDHLVFKQLAEPREYQGVHMGQSYQVLEVRYGVVPNRAGSYVIGPSRMNLTVLQPRSRTRRGPFDDPFFSFSAGRTLTLASESLQLKVLPLPESGRPYDFSGLVGNFSIESKLEPSSVRAGESATLTVRVTGQGNVKRIPDLKIPEVKSVKIYADQPVLEVSQGASALKGTKTMKWALVPEKAGELRLPPLALSYFDPESRQYQTRKTMLPPLSVLSPKTETLSARGGSKQPEAVEKLKEEVKDLGHDILPVHTSVKDLLPTASLRPKAWRLYLFTLTPLCIYLIAFYSARARKQSEKTLAATRAKKALKNFLRRYRRGNMTAEQTLDAIRFYLNDRCGLSLGALTSEEADAVLEAGAVSSETRNLLHNRIRTIELAIYSGNADEPSIPGNDLVKIMQQVDREL